MGFVLYRLGERMDFQSFKYIGIFCFVVNTVINLSRFSDRYIEVTDSNMVFPPLDIFQKPLSIPFKEIYSLETLSGDRVLVKTIHGKSILIVKQFMKSGEFENLIGILSTKKTPNAKPSPSFKKTRIKERLLPYVAIVPGALFLLWMANL